MGEEDLKRFSIKLAQVMDDIGVNEEIISLRRHIRFLMDRIWNIRCNSLHFKHETFGSQSEGSTTIGMQSDIDTLCYSDRHVACVHLSDCQDSKSNYFVFKEPTSLPQCCYLQAVGRLENNTYFLVKRDIKSHSESIGNGMCPFIYDQKGRLLLNSTSIINMFIQFLDNHSPSNVRQNGPAFTFNDDEDNVIAIRCMILPDNCKVLFTRPRPGHWPTQGTLSKAKQCEVYMVHPGLQGHRFGYNNERRVSFIKLQYQHEYVDSQFRISTNMTERLLLFDLNIVQMKVYIITKMIRKEFIQPIVDECLSTFHMKTAVLFTIEQFPENIWRDDNLVQCVIYCLNTLRRFLKRGYCPHYTISSVNLFGGKLTVNEFKIVKENVTEIINSSLSCLRKLCMDDVGLRLSASSVGLRKGNILSGPEMRFTIIMQVIKTCRHDHEQMLLVNYTILEMWVLAIKSAIATNCEYKKELEYIFQSMCNNLASQKASACIANGREVTRDIICMYETSLRSSEISNHIRYASMLVCTTQFERAYALLETIERMIISDMIQIRELSKKSTNVKRKTDYRSDEFPPTEIINKYVSNIIYPLKFIRSEIHCVPGHLIYENFRSITDDEIQYSESHACERNIYPVFVSNLQAFLYYLQYLSSKNRDQKLRSLAQLSDYCERKVQIRKRDHLHVATALHMLGHIVELENRLPDAWKLYRLSVAIKPKFNAAYWHLFRLLGQVVYSKSR
ncbi:uncharacterized protein LOC127834738 [Dreissena polymorpha]|uniref:uncharacterized protein LOC127834738 n=1 Tax=Dreissena polymorpha TaxID=45954 RepID=UPI0022642464|nr:uncharacterized protein LOC127834738 [Dreissena polymorpha]